MEELTYEDKNSRLWGDSEKERNLIEKLFPIEETTGVLEENELGLIIKKMENFLPITPPEDPEVTKKGLQLLKENIDKVHPLYLLSKAQKELLLSSVKFTLLPDKKVIYSQDSVEDSKAAYIILEGKLSFFGKGSYLLDTLTPVNFFGYDGPVFGKRLTTVVGKKNTLLAIIPEKTFLDLIEPFSNFAIYLERTIKLKDRVLEPLDKFKHYILTSINDEKLNLEEAIKLYKKTNPCLHPKANSKELDIMAWSYSLNRLPPKIFETYFYVLQNKPPFLKRINTKDSIDDISIIKNKARPRDVFFKDGKSVILVRDMETDVLDFVSNLCIYLIECKKLRKELLNPKIVKNILAEIKAGTSTFDSTCAILEKYSNVKMTNEEKDAIRGYFKNDFGKKLLDLIWNHQAISVSIQKKVAINKLSLELWAENLLSDIKKCLGTDKAVNEIDDLVVDICQGSKSTLISCINPYLYKNKEAILKWAEEKNIQLKTKKFLNENDKLIAYAYYYFKENPDKQNESQAMLEENGVLIDYNTFGTGVALLLVNVNKLNPQYMDPNITFKPASKNHIILHIGYTFGNQSREIINPVLMMLGKKARSLNIIGKAGGLVGNRTDILAASRIFCDKQGEMVNLNMGEFNVEEFKAKVNTGVHVGPLLCVAGTILQNYDLLNYYTKINGCVGLEMEGYYYAAEVNEGVTHGMLRSDFISRFFYYVSDLPLVPGETLSAEGGNVCWEEGVGSMNAIQRHVLNCLFHE